MKKSNLTIVIKNAGLFTNPEQSRKCTEVIEKLKEYFFVTILIEKCVVTNFASVGLINEGPNTSIEASSVLKQMGGVLNNNNIITRIVNKEKKTVSHIVMTANILISIFFYVCVVKIVNINIHSDFWLAMSYWAILAIIVVVNGLLYNILYNQESIINYEPKG